MSKLHLTDSDLETLKNALLCAKRACDEAALETPIIRAGMNGAFEKSAKQYNDLCDKLEDAEEIHYVCECPDSKS